MDLDVVKILLARIGVLLERNAAVNAHSLQQQMNLGWDGVLVIVVAALTLFVAVLAFATSLQMKRLQEAASKRDKIYQELISPKLEHVTSFSAYNTNAKIILLYCRLRNVGSLPAKLTSIEFVNFANQKFADPVITRKSYSIPGSRNHYGDQSNHNFASKIPILTNQSLDILLTIQASEDMPDKIYRQICFRCNYGGISKAEIFTFSNIELDYLVDPNKFFNTCRLIANTSNNPLMSIPEEVFRSIKKPPGEHL